MLIFERTTVFGMIQTHAIDLAENSIFVGPIRVARRQRGCLRFCYVTPGSRTPRRYRCQPDLAEQDACAAIPAQDIDPAARVTFVVGANEQNGERDDPQVCSPACSPACDAANLELTVEVNNRTPAVGDEIVVTFTLDNHGPRDATGVAVTIWPPTADCLELIGTTLSQGSIDSDSTTADSTTADSTTADSATAVWQVGKVRAGGRAMLTAMVSVTAACHAPETVRAAITAATLTGDGQAFIADAIQRVRQRVRPRFTTIHYGTPAYAQLALDCPTEITRGADNESEMGAFHDLFQPQRAANLEARLDEFVPAGMDTGIIYAS